VKIYVSGPLRLHIDQRRDVSNLNLVMRRIAICKHFPVCPSVMYESFFRDPRFKDDLSWYYDFARTLMEGCDLFCFVYEPLGYMSEITSWERETFHGIKIPEDGIINYLSFANRER